MTRRVVNERGYVIGEGHHRAKLSELQVVELLALREQGWLFRELAAHFNVSESAAKNVCSGRCRAQLAATSAPCKQVQGEPARYAFEPLQRAWGGP
jgi:hypothetical protein